MKSEQTISQTSSQPHFLSQLVQFCKSSTRESVELEMQVQIVRLHNQLQQTKMELIQCKQQLSSKAFEIQIKNQCERLLEIQKNEYLLNQNQLIEQVKQMEAFANQLKMQKQQIRADYQKQVGQLNKKIQQLEASVQNTKKISRLEMQQNKKTYQQSYQKLQRELEKSKTEGKQKDNTIKQLQSTNSRKDQELREIQELIFDKFQPYCNKECDQNNRVMVMTAAARLQQLEQERKQLVDFLRNYEGKNDYLSVPVKDRVEAICQDFSKKAQKIEVILSNFQKKLNNSLKLLDKSYEQAYDDQLVDKVNSIIIDKTSKIADFKAKLSQIQNKKCDYCQLKQTQINSLKVQVNKIIKQHQGQITKKKNEYDKLFKILDQKQKSVNSLQQSIEQSQRKISRHQQEYLKQKQGLKSSILQIQSRNAELQDLKQIIQSQVKQIQQLKQQKNKVSKQKQQLQNQLLSLNKKSSSSESDSLKMQQQIQKLRMEFKKLSQQNKQSSELIAKMMDQQEANLGSQRDMKQNNQIMKNKIIQLQQLLHQKSRQVQSIQQQLCQFVNRNIKAKNLELQLVKSVRQALKSLDTIMAESGPNKAAALFTPPPLVDEFAENLNWIKIVINQYTSNSRSISSKFVGIIDQKNNDFSKLLSNNNTFCICLTQKGAIFCIFITKLTKTIKDKDPAVILCPKKSFRFPEQLKNQSARPSMVDNNNNLVLGRQQILIKNSMQIKIDPSVKNKYYGDLDIYQIFGIESMDQQIRLKKMQVYQVRFD